MKELSEDTHFLLMYDLASVLSNNKICSQPWAALFKFGICKIRFIVDCAVYFPPSSLSFTVQLKNSVFSMSLKEGSW